MPNVIIAFDEKDSTLGSFFIACKEHLNNFFSSKSIVISELGSDQLNELAVTMHIGHLSSFIFGAYSHGAKDSLLKSATTEYVTIEKNGNAFNGGFVYTFSCSSGKELGRDLIMQDCLCFIGYTSTVYIWTNYFAPFVECANHGLIEFFNGFSATEVLSSMIHKYNEEIDRMYEIDPMVAADLVANRKALVMHGNNISIDNFN